MNHNNIIYNNKPNKKAIGRILFDISEIEKNKKDLNEIEGIYFSFNVENKIETKYHMLLIGPDDSPYEGGFYIFEAVYPDEYPFYPMSMKSLTQGGNIRKHPNLYICGKCCFSFLGTWQGPPWTAVHNPQTVGISMKSVLTKNPINNEPGWENRDDSNTRLYEKLIEYFNIKFGVVEIIKKLLEGESEIVNKFKEGILRNFDKYYSRYIETLEKFKEDDEKVIESPVYGFSVHIDYKNLKNILINLKNKRDKDNENR